MWKKLQLLCLLVVPSIGLAQPEGYVDPLTFTGSDAEKTQVIEYIKASVYETFCKKHDQCSASTLRMMEQADLDAFKYLATNAKRNEKAFKQVHKRFCLRHGQCRYHTLKMMFDHEDQKSKEELKW